MTCEHHSHRGRTVMEKTSTVVFIATRYPLDKFKTRAMQLCKAHKGLTAKNLKSKFKSPKVKKLHNKTIRRCIGGVKIFRKNKSSSTISSYISLMTSMTTKSHTIL